MCSAHTIEVRRNMEANESKKAYKLKGRKNIKYCLYWLRLLACDHQFCIGDKDLRPVSITRSTSTAPLSTPKSNNKGRRGRGCGNGNGNNSSLKETLLSTIDTWTSSSGVVSAISSTTTSDRQTQYGSSKSNSSILFPADDVNTPAMIAIALITMMIMMMMILLIICTTTCWIRACGIIWIRESSKKWLRNVVHVTRCGISKSYGYNLCMTEKREVRTNLVEKLVANWTAWVNTPD